MAELDQTGVSVQEIAAAVAEFARSTNTITSMARQVKEIAHSLRACVSRFKVS